MTKYERAVKLWRSYNVTTESDINLRLDNFRILFAYNSGKIENDAITYDDTREVFENGQVLNYTGNPRTLFETQNQRLERLLGKRTVVVPTSKPSLLIDIQAKIQQGYGAGFEHYAKLRNLKEMAKTLIYLQERGLDEYAVLKEKSASATSRFNDLSDKIKAADNRMSDIAALQKHIGNYNRTWDVYVQYRKSGYSKKFYDTHTADIILHQAAKKYFDSLGLKKLPSMQSLRQEYAILAAEKKKYYQEYRQAKDEMRELLTAKSNVDRFLNIPTPTRDPRKNTEPSL